ncbi:MAG: hypothetical protein RLZZ148_867 [Cyanobacteriota bacterium]|jgi:hypothetical protein
MRYSSSQEIHGREEAIALVYDYPRPIPKLTPQLYRQQGGSIITLRDQKVPQRGREKPQPVFINQIGQIHLENMKQSLERRLEAAQARGDAHLINLLKKESLALGC